MADACYRVDVDGDPVRARFSHPPSTETLAALAALVKAVRSMPVEYIEELSGKKMEGRGEMVTTGEKSNKALYDAVMAMAAQAEWVRGLCSRGGPPEYGKEEIPYTRETARTREWLVEMVENSDSLRDAIEECNAEVSNLTRAPVE